MILTKEMEQKQMNNQIEYDFKVGDEVITSTGAVGIIEDICNCSCCKERGFCEPQVKTIIGNGTIYITDNDKRVNFRSFYKIGDYVFGNLDKDCLLYDITSKTEEKNKLCNEIEMCYRQLVKILELECEYDG